MLEKLKSGVSLNAKEKTIREQRLVSVLKQLYDEIDIAVLDGYGWNDLAEQMQIVNGNAPVGAIHESPLQNRADVKCTLDEALLERIVALNSERAEEEKRGIVRWLRPQYQNKRSLSGVEGSGTEASVISVQSEMEMDTETEAPAIIIAEKIASPKGDIEQIKAVIDVLVTSKSPVELDAIAAHFTSKGAWKKRLPSILDMLVVGKVRVESGKFTSV